jgi:glycerol-3-phosphate responsive antiterminator
VTTVRLPTVLIADDGRQPIDAPAGLPCGLLLRDTDLSSVVARAASARGPMAVDLDSVRGLQADDAAVEFVIDRLGIPIVLTRRSQAARRAAELGALGLIHVLAFDSTGLGRSLEANLRTDGVGSVLSPGLVLAHMQPSEVDRLPRPIVGYGLITDPDDALACLRLADAVALRPAAAAAFGGLVASMRRNGYNLVGSP